MTKNYQCPRCNNKKIISYENTIECPNCALEFDKADLDLLEENQILSIKEKLSFIESIKKRSL